MLINKLIIQNHQNWEEKHLSEISLLIKDGTHGTHPRIQSGILLLSAKNISENGEIIWNDEDSRISLSEYEKIHKNYELKVLDLLITIVGTLGRRALIRPGKSNFTIQRSVAVVRCNQQLIIPQYLYHFTGTNYFQRQLVIRSNATAQAGLYLGELENIKIYFPSKIKEQQRIAEILDTIDEAIARTEALIRKLKQIKAGLLSDLLTRGLDENGELRDPDKHPEQFKDSQLGRIPGDWEVARLSQFYAVPTRNGLYKPAKFYGRGILMIHMPQMFRGLIVDVSDAARVTLNSNEIERFKLEAGDLVFARRSLSLEGAGRCSLVPEFSETITFESSIIRVRLLTNKLRPVFANSFLNSEIGFRLRLPLIRQVAVSGVSSEDIASIIIPSPKIDEQDVIIKIINTQEARIQQEQAYLDKLKQQKKGLMHDLLTGKVRVNT